MREDAHQLFAFLTPEERETFRQLIRISGIGPRTALAILSGLSVADLAGAVTRQEAGRLQKVPNAYLVIDPWYGLQQMPVTGNRIGLYKPVDAQGKVLSRGTWDGWVCKVV